VLPLTIFCPLLSPRYDSAQKLIVCNQAVMWMYVPCHQVHAYLVIHLVTGLKEN
jgi:hypothetical protein